MARPKNYHFTQIRKAAIFEEYILPGFINSRFVVYRFLLSAAHREYLALNVKDIDVVYFIET
jgi:hypothetical protein